MGSNIFSPLFILIEKDCHFGSADLSLAKSTKIYFDPAAASLIFELVGDLLKNRMFSQLA